MFEGVAYAKRNEPKQPFLVLAKTSNNIRIYPNTRAEFINRWYNSRIENGTYGLYATIKAGKSPKKVKVTMDISENKNP